MSTPASQHPVGRRWASALTAAALVLVGVFGASGSAFADDVEQPPAVEQVTEAPVTEAPVAEAPAEEAPAQQAPAEEVPTDKPRSDQQFSALAAVDPQVTVTPSTDIDTTVANTFTVSGTGFTGDGAVFGAYVLLGPASTWAGGSALPGAGWTQQTWVQASQVTDGAFRTTLTVGANTLDPTVNYVVATSAAHGLSITDRTLDTITPLTLKAIVVTPPVTPIASITVTPTTNLADEATVTVSGDFPATVLGDLGTSAGVPLTTGVYLMYCAQPTGAVGTSGGRASGALCDSPRQKYLAASAGPAGATVIGSVSDGRWTFSQELTVTDAFGTGVNLKQCLAATAGGVQCGVFVRLYHGFTATQGASAPNLANPYVYDQFVPVTFAAPVTPTPTANITVAPTTNLADDATVTVTGDFPATVVSDLGATKDTALTTGVYLMYCVQPSGTVGTTAGRPTGTQCDVGQQKYLASAAGPAGATVTGTVNNGRWTFSADLTVSSSFGTSTVRDCLAATTNAVQCGVFVRLYHGFTATQGASAPNLANPYVYDQFVPVTFAAPVTPVDPGNPGTNPGNPGNPTNPAPTVSLSVTPGSVDRAVANTFTVSGSGYTGAGAVQGVYVSIGSSSVWQPGQVPSTGGWLQSAYIAPAGIANGSFSTTITIPAGTFVAGQSYGAATFAAHGLSLTNRTLDAWAPISLGGATASAAVSTKAANTPDATPPATTGITGSTTAQEGNSFTAEAEGFTPNEQGILVVIYSTPATLGTVTADADGVATWTGILPTGLTGTHTLTFQGSVDRGLVLDIAAADVIGCPVTDASITWGLKESFRSYISGSIANGEWVVSDGATYETPDFGFSEGVGGYDASAAEGLVAFPGAITFTGHGGILNTTVANPTIRFDGSGKGTLLLDVSGTTQEGAPVSALAVEFLDLDLSAATVTDGVFSVEAAGAVLTAAGAEAFGTYPEGEAFDPIALSFGVDSDCVSAAETPAAETPDTEVTSSDSPNLWWIWLIAGVAIIAVIAAIVVMVLRRRQAS